MRSHYFSDGGKILLILQQFILPRFFHIDYRNSLSSLSEKVQSDTKDVISGSEKEISKIDR